MATIIGTNGNDRIATAAYGGSTNALENATDGADSIAGGEGNDIIAPGGGADTLDGGLGFNTLDYSLASGPVTITLTGANGSLMSGTASGDGADVFANFTAFAGANGGGNSFNSGSLALTSFAFFKASPGGNDAFGFGTSGNVIADFRGIAPVAGGGLTYSGTANTITLPGGAVDSFTGSPTIYATTGGDTFIGGATGGGYEGGAGVDSYVGGAGQDRLEFRTAPAGVVVDLSQDRIFNDGFGNAETAVGMDQVSGSDFGDTVIGNAANNVIRPLGGSDSVDGGGGIDTVRYTAGSAATPFIRGAFVDLVAQRAIDPYGGTDTVLGFERIQGTDVPAFGDTLLGDGGANTIEGFSGNDTILGGGGADSLSGGSFNDTFGAAAGDGDDTIDGGTGTNRLDYTAIGAPVTVTLSASGASGTNGTIIGAGTDSFSNIDDIAGAAGGGNVFTATSNSLNLNVRLKASTGNDQYDFGTSGVVFADYRSLPAGSGLVFDGAARTITHGSSISTTTGFAGILATNAGDTFIGGADGGLFEGGAGVDSFVGGSGQERLFFQNAPTAVHVDLSQDKVLNDGYGNVENAIDIDGVNGSDFGDTIIGDERANSLRPLGGNDMVDGGGGVDTLFYNTRNFDPIRGAIVDLETGVAIDPYGGSDTLVSIENLRGVDLGTYGDTLAGDGLANRLEGLIGNDSLAGRAGDDTLVGGLGNDSVDGGEGRDLIDFSGATAAVNAVVRNGLMTDGQGGTDSVTGIEGAVGSRFDDTLSTSDAGGILYGEAGNDRLIGDSGADNLRGGAGLDTLTGGAGQDTLSGFSGSDSLDGGAGNDMLDFTGATAGVNIDLDNATVADGQGGTDSFTGFEGILGSGFADTLVGRTEDAGVLLGQGGYDEIFGWNGADSLDGGAGADTLWGGIGNDMLTGGDGSNLLLGEDGEDVANYMAFAPTSLVLRQETDGATVVEHFGADGIRTGIDRLLDIEQILTSDGLLRLGNLDEVFKATNAAGESTLLLGTVYSGPVAYLERQLLGGGGGEIVGGSSRNDFINTFGGDDAIDAGAGNDVLDGGTGSNFMTGGAGFDVFFSDGRGGTTTWSTITDWQAGEQLSLWGYRPDVSQLLWLDSDGAEGYKGVTLHADLDGNGVIDTSVTWSSLTFAELPPALEYDGLLWFQ